LDDEFDDSDFEEIKKYYGFDDDPDSDQSYMN
jgi:hypothetical protein